MAAQKNLKRYVGQKIEKQDDEELSWEDSSVRCVGTASIGFSRFPFTPPTRLRERALSCRILYGKIRTTSGIVFMRAAIKKMETAAGTLKS